MVPPRTTTSRQLAPVSSSRPGAPRRVTRRRAAGVNPAPPLLDRYGPTALVERASRGLVRVGETVEPYLVTVPPAPPKPVSPFPMGSILKVRSLAFISSPYDPHPHS